MDNQRIICIDFGSAYTKVAIRHDWNESAQIVSQPSIADQDVDFCVPSVVARVDRARSHRWAIGLAASEQQASASVKVYRDWKASLILNTVGNGGTLPRTECREVAVRFFSQLKDALASVKLTRDAVDFPVRICVPALEGDGTLESRIVDILTRSGWTPAAERPVLFEPETNAAGIFTRGRNATWVPPRSNTLHPYYQAIFQGDYGGLLHEIMIRLRAPGRHYGVLVLDLGAFTTDFGYVRLDDSFFDPNTPRPKVAQLSRQIGVRELDQTVLDRARPEVQAAIRRMSPAAWERNKRQLYNKRTIKVANPPAGSVTIGGSGDSTVISEAINELRDRIVEAYREFRRSHVSGEVDAYVLSGGGMMISVLRAGILQALAVGHSGRLFDLLDEHEPYGALLRKVRGPNGMSFDPAEVELRQRENQRLVRGGSAMGGCSVFFEHW